jgi:Colicin V production protein.
MNWSDYVVLAIIIGFGLAGLVKGLVLSVFKIASFFIAIVLSVKLYPKAADFLAKTPLYDNIKASILKSLLGRYEAAVPVSSQDGASALDTVVNRLALPDFIKKSIIEKIPAPSDIIDVSTILGNISDEMAKVIISILGVVLLFILIRLGIFIIGFILKGVTRLPVIRELDRFGGLAFGALEGILMVYILFAVLMLFNSSVQFKHIFENIESSVLANNFYQNNIIISWMFPK